MLPSVDARHSGWRTPGDEDVVNLPRTVNNLSREKPDMLTQVISIKEHLSSICPCDSCSALNRQSRLQSRASTPTRARWADRQ
jgi:hypothetical protein